MSQQDITSYREKIKRIGRWAGTRMLRNRGVPFELAYFILFDRKPRLV